MSLIIFILIALMILSHSYGQDTSPHHSTWEDWKHWIHHWTGYYQDMPKELPTEMPDIPKEVNVKAKGKGEVSIKEGDEDLQRIITLKVPDTDLKRPLKKIDIPEKKSELKVESKSKSPTRKTLKSRDTKSPAAEPVEKPDIVIPKKSKANPTLKPTRTVKTGKELGGKDGGKGKEGKGKEGKDKEGKGKEGKGKEDGLKKVPRRSLKRGTDGGKANEGKANEGKGKEDKDKEGKGKEAGGTDGGKKNDGKGKEAGGKDGGNAKEGSGKKGEVYSRRSLKAEFIPPFDMYSFPFPIPKKGKGKGKEFYSYGWN